MKTTENHIQTGKMEVNVKGQMFYPWVDYCNNLNWVLYICFHFMCQHEYISPDKGSIWQKRHS